MADILPSVHQCPPSGTDIHLEASDSQAQEMEQTNIPRDVDLNFEAL